MPSQICTFLHIFIGIHWWNDFHSYIWVLPICDLFQCFQFRSSDRIAQLSSPFVIAIAKCFAINTSETSAFFCTKLVSHWREAFKSIYQGKPANTQLRCLWVQSTNVVQMINAWGVDKQSWTNLICHKWYIWRWESQGERLVLRNCQKCQLYMVSFCAVNMKIRGCDRKSERQASLVGAGLQRATNADVQGDP